MSTRQSILSPQLASIENGHIAAGWDTFAVFPLSQALFMESCSGTPKEGMSYFFSVGDFGVAACETAYKARRIWELWMKFGQSGHPTHLPARQVMWKDLVALVTTLVVQRISAWVKQVVDTSKNLLGWQNGRSRFFSSPYQVDLSCCPFDSHESNLIPHLFIS